MPGRDAPARTWFDQARADLAAAEDSAATRHHEWACFQAQQAGEKALNAYPNGLDSETTPAAYCDEKDAQRCLRSARLILERASASFGN